MYLFAGRRRQSDVASFLQQANDEGRIRLTLKEYDLELSPNHDLTDLSIWQDIWSTLKEGGWSLLVSPPCDTFSRARFHFLESPGPRPLRNFIWPRGFPWLSQRHKAVVEEANLFVDRCIAACVTCHAAGGKFIIEHPEDLGLVKGERPGSIWQWPEILELIPSCNANSFAIQQCHFGALTPKPTRFLSTFEFQDDRCHFGLPRLDKLGVYKGPLPKSCGHFHKHKLLGKTANKWNTSPSASYPPGLCRFLAELVLNATASCGRGKSNQSQQVAGTSGQQYTGKGGSSSSKGSSFGQNSNGGGESLPKGITPCNSGSRGSSSTSLDGASKNCTVDLTGEDSKVRELDADERDAEGFDMEACCNFGPPIKVEWDGKTHDFVDGFGMCSPILSLEATAGRHT